jgi:hypothetical protein
MEQGKGWGPVFAAIERGIDQLAERKGYATRDELAALLSDQPEVLNGKKPANSVDWFSAYYKRSDPLVASAVAKYSRVKVADKWAYYPKGAPHPRPRRRLRPDGRARKATRLPPPVTGFDAGSLLNDTAILTVEQDRLSFEPTAETMASFINADKTATPVVIAVNAQWGTGKSSLVNIILRKLERRTALEKLLRFLFLRPRWARLLTWCRNREEGSTIWRFGTAVAQARAYDKRDRHTVLRFDAWMHDDAPQIASAFASEVLTAANAARPLWSQIVRPVPLRYTGWVAKTGMLLMLSLGAILLVALYYLAVANGLVPPDLIPMLQGWLRGSTSAEKIAPTAAVAILGFGAKHIKDVYDSLQKYINNPERAAADARLVRVSAKLRSLLQQATTRRRRFIIYIDNIERCKPENALTLLEVVNQLLSHPQVVVIVAGDMELVAASAGSRFKEQAKLLARKEGSEAAICLEFGRRYVRKMVQLSIGVPQASKGELDTLTLEATT